MKLMAILAASLMPVACGSLSPTSPDEASAITTTVTVASTARGVAPRLATNCTAQGIVLNAARNEMKITAVFVDRLGNPVIPTGCPMLVWSVSPDGAYIEELSSGPIGATEVELVSVGILDDTVYKVTATSGALSGSINMTFKPGR
jgi:hypothetical protein